MLIILLSMAQTEMAQDNLIIVISVKGNMAV